MFIKVLITRNFKKENIHNANYHNVQIRALAMVQPGYISGETMTSLNNPNEMIIVSTWESKEQWDSWYESSIRKDYYDKLKADLESDEKLAFFTISSTK